MVNPDEEFIDRLLDIAEENIFSIDVKSFLDVALKIHDEMNFAGLKWESVPMRFMDLYHEIIMERDPAYWEHCCMLAVNGLEDALSYTTEEHNEVR